MPLHQNINLNPAGREKVSGTGLPWEANSNQRSGAASGQGFRAQIISRMTNSPSGSVQNAPRPLSPSVSERKANSEAPGRLPDNFNLKPPLRGNLPLGQGSSQTKENDLVLPLRGGGNLNNFYAKMQPLGQGNTEEARAIPVTKNEPVISSVKEGERDRIAPKFTLINQRSGLYMASQIIRRGLEQNDSQRGTGPDSKLADGKPARPASGAKTAPREYYEKLADDAASRHGLDPHLVRAVIKAESSFNPGLVSQAGAAGLMQLMPGTASDMKVKDVFDPAQNIEGGAKYLAWLSRKFAGDETKILAAYNWGPGNVNRGGRMPLETRNYLQRVKNFREDYRQAALAGQKSPLRSRPQTLAVAAPAPQPANSAG
ncbi:MAG: lytic transglycosylase domain-containing protein [Desulfarculales bacterium]|nr:lytic transglycosylase domain-containing protein [Desulfarculales bacterium]